MHFATAAAADWRDPQGLMTVCTPQTGSTLPSDLKMSAGVTDATDSACTPTFSYTVGAQEAAVVTAVVTNAVHTRTMRMCRWCTSTTSFATHASLYLKDFVPPTTASRKLSGITVWATNTAGKGYLTIDTVPTLTPQKSVVIASGGCGKSGQTTKKSTKGQTVEFTMKSPVALSYG